MILTSDIQFQERLKRWARYFVFAVIVIAAIQLLGIFFNIGFLTNPISDFHAMNEITAVGIIMMAVAFLLCMDKRDSRWNHIFSNMLAVVVLLAGILRFLSYVLRSMVEIKVLFNRESVSTSTAFCAILAGIVLLLINGKGSRRVALSHYVAAVIFFFAIFSLIVNSYHAHSFKGIFTVPMAFYSAICFLLFSIATLLANPDKGLMNELTTVYAGSISARRLIPVAIIFPFIYGFIRLYGEWAGFYNKEFGTALSVLAVTITCLAFIIYNARMLNRRDMVNEHSKSELTEANYFLHTVLENIPDMIFVKDAKDLRFFRFNKAGEELLGYSKDDLIGKNDYDFFPKEQADFFIKKDRDVLNNNTLVNIDEEPIMTKNGERWLHTKKIPVRDENGVPVYLLGISEDITERRKVDEQLRQLNAELERRVLERTEELSKSEQKFRKLLENNFETIALSGEDFIPFYRSPSTDRITGWTTEERIKRGGPVVETHPEDFHLLKNAMQQALESPAKAIPISFRTRHKEGRYIWLEGFITNMLHDESLKGIITNFRDVTERKQYELKIEESEKKYRHLFENNPMPMWVVDSPSSRFIDVNEATILHYGYSREEFLSMTPLDIRPEEDKQPYREATNLIQRTTGNKGIWKHLKKDGTLISVEIITHEIFFEGKQARLILAHDVTEKRQAEEEINKLTVELRQLLEHTQTSREEERKYIAREIHDELGQRLTALKIDVSMMKRKMPANGQQNYFSDEIGSFIRQIDQSIESVKRIATDLRPEILDHHGIIAAVKWQAHQFENVTGMKCKVLHLPDDLHLSSELATAVYRTVQEALTNITRHAQATSVSILIELDSKKLSVEIKDNGKGIHEEHVRSMKSLGLIGIRERVNLLKGTLSIAGKPGKGTVVSIHIPV